MNKRIFSTILALMLLLGCIPVLAEPAVSGSDDADITMTEYGISELGMKVELPSDWYVITSSSVLDPNYYPEGYASAEDYRADLIKSKRYMYATVKDNLNQHEICIYVPNSNESDDYDTYFDFHLERLAKASFNEQNEQEGSGYTYKTYKVIENKAGYKFMVFDYEMQDGPDSVIAGRFYHTVVNGTPIDIDLTAYNTLSGEFIRIFDAMVDSLTFNHDGMSMNEAGKSFLTPKVKMVLTIVAYVILGIALITAIALFVVSNAKEKQKIDEVYRQQVENANADEQNENNQTQEENTEAESTESTESTDTAESES